MKIKFNGTNNNTQSGDDETVQIQIVINVWWVVAILVVGAILIKTTL